MKVILTLLVTLLLIILAKMIWVAIMTRDLGSFETERKDILQRRNFLFEKVITDPQSLVDAMPSAIGVHYQGEWAIYTTSMLAAALVNTSILYPETRKESVEKIDSLIKITMSPELRGYDAYSWGEDPLESLGGDKSHISYISLLAWMISGYKTVGGDRKYDALFDELCATMARRIQKSPNYNLTTFPGTMIFIPDMLVAIVALENYAQLNGGKYQDVVDAWVQNMKQNHLDKKTGLIMSILSDCKKEGRSRPVMGSYSALSVYYLTFVDEGFAREQYDLLKKTFLKKRPFTGLRETDKGTKGGYFLMDSGPVIFGLSPSGTAFGIGSATYFQDSDIRKRFLRTGEMAGFSVKKKDTRHYILADYALVGEAITLSMRTAVPWY
jgi:hypothetical protein